MLTRRPYRLPGFSVVEFDPGPLPEVPFGANPAVVYGAYMETVRAFADWERRVSGVSLVGLVTEDLRGAVVVADTGEDGLTWLFAWPAIWLRCRWLNLGRRWLNWRELRKRARYFSPGQVAARMRASR